MSAPGHVQAVTGRAVQAALREEDEEDDDAAVAQWVHMTADRSGGAHAFVLQHGGNGGGGGAAAGSAESSAAPSSSSQDRDASWQLAAAPPASYRRAPPTRLVVPDKSAGDAALDPRVFYRHMLKERLRVFMPDKEDMPAPSDAERLQHLRAGHALARCQGAYHKLACMARQVETAVQSYTLPPLDLMQEIRGAAAEVESTARTMHTTIRLILDNVRDFTVQYTRGIAGQLSSALNNAYETVRRSETFIMAIQDGSLAIWRARDDTWYEALRRLLFEIPQPEDVTDEGVRGALRDCSAALQRALATSDMQDSIALVNSCIATLTLMRDNSLRARDAASIGTRVSAWIIAAGTAVRELHARIGARVAMAEHSSDAAIQAARRRIEEGHRMMRMKQDSVMERAVDLLVRATERGTQEIKDAVEDNLAAHLHSATDTVARVIAAVSSVDDRHKDGIVQWSAAWRRLGAAGRDLVECDDSAAQTLVMQAIAQGILDAVTASDHAASVDDVLQPAAASSRGT